MVMQLLFALCLGILSSGFALSTATAQPAPVDSVPEPAPDPLEGFNQPVFQFNLKMDQYVLRPIATGYNAVMPDAAQRGVSRFFRNLGVVERFANNLFQGNFSHAGQEVGRFFVNTTLGGVGFVDSDASESLAGERPSRPFYRSNGRLPGMQKAISCRQARRDGMGSLLRSDKRQ